MEEFDYVDILRLIKGNSAIEGSGDLLPNKTCTTELNFLGLPWPFPLFSAILTEPRGSAHITPCLKLCTDPAVPSDTGHTGFSGHPGLVLGLNSSLQGLPHSPDSTLPPFCSVFAFSESL